MSSWIILFPAFFISLSAISDQLRNTSLTGIQDRHEGDEEHLVQKNLTIAWVYKPPYTISAANESQEGNFLMRDVLFPHIVLECGNAMGVRYQVKTFRADNEFHMIELLRQNKVHVAAPIFESTNRRYDEFIFVKITDYPGSEYITSEDGTNKLSLILNAVLKSWSLFAVTLILTAIAGIIMWALVSLTLCT